MRFYLLFSVATKHKARDHGKCVAEDWGDISCFLSLPPICKSVNSKEFQQLHLDS